MFSFAILTPIVSSKDPSEFSNQQTMSVLVLRNQIYMRHGDIRENIWWCKTWGWKLFEICRFPCGCTDSASIIHTRWDTKIQNWALSNVLSIKSEEIAKFTNPKKEAAIYNIFIVRTSTSLGTLKLSDQILSRRLNWIGINFSSEHLKYETHLLFISHGTSSEDGHFGHGFFLQPLQRITFRAQQLANEIKLWGKKHDVIGNGSLHNGSIESLNNDEVALSGPLWFYFYHKKAKLVGQK